MSALQKAKAPGVVTRLDGDVRRAAAALNAVSLAAMVYVFDALLPFPQLWYSPLPHAWSFGAKPEGVAMAWYGRTLWVLTAALLAWVFPGRRVRIGVRSVVCALALVAALSLCIHGAAVAPLTPLPLTPLSLKSLSAVRCHE